MQQVCFFIGNRDASPMLWGAVCDAVESAIVKHHVELFVTGGRGRLDRMAAQAVQKLKLKYPNIRLCLLLAYHPSERPVFLPQGYDESFYPLERPVPARFAIARVNRYMMDHSTVCIAYAAFPGHARNMLAYARQLVRTGRLAVIDLSDEPLA